MKSDRIHSKKSSRYINSGTPPLELIKMILSELEQLSSKQTTSPDLQSQIFQIVNEVNKYLRYRENEAFYLKANNNAILSLNRLETVN